MFKVVLNLSKYYISLGFTSQSKLILDERVLRSEIHGPRLAPFRYVDEYLEQAEMDWDIIPGILISRILVNLGWAGTFHVESNFITSRHRSVIILASWTETARWSSTNPKPYQSEGALLISPETNQEAIATPHGEAPKKWGTRWKLQLCAPRKHFFRLYKIWILFLKWLYSDMVDLRQTMWTSFSN